MVCESRELKISVLSICCNANATMDTKMKLANHLKTKKKAATGSVPLAAFNQKQLIFDSYMTYFVTMRLCKVLKY
jgi:N-acetylmuramic acid 6-phosphate (MurNAc-6-P) etherase